ncbi:ABC transporter permease [Dysosmobacter sp. NSJ-60]|uniref:ABC transporter permease n=1 Tax=Pusillibacter faecalis TaxID=2714358 RepID=A0A810QH67_9FIRM|nr:ABC transporter permease [Pusillibacter faecalis]MBC5747855.1 ABC transporter permease [Dysosmobacter hominis]MBS5656880.1 ABC transporter permease [Oscillibacter sp.]MCQ5025729.1 ABC transporter permease [Oscillibacter valericigenes]BCK85176.1 ABC transporter permease [Pusillibacter faecalis]
MSHVKSHSREPLLRIAKREGISRPKAYGVRAAAVLLSLVVSGIFIFTVTKLNPIAVYEGIYDGAFGTPRRFWATIRDTMMLLCIGVGLAPAFKMRFWNIGAEGQILIGGVITAGFMRFYGGTIPTPVLLVLMAAVSLTAGGVWGVIPATFKARWNTNETLFTLMMNYVAIQITSYCVALWEFPVGSNTVGVIHQQTKYGWFPEIFGQEYGLNVILVMTLTVGMYIYLKYSKHGYEITVVGDSENTARYAGISVKKVTVRTMAISGAICGLAGFIAVAGVGHTISTSTAGGRGFTAIIVAWLAQFNTFVMILISLLLVFLQKGAIQIATQFGLNDYASNIITGIILFFILGSEFFINYRVIIRSRKEGAK